jgi:serine/threonine protein kinase
VYRGEYYGRPAAVKLMRLYASDDLGSFLSVCAPFHAARGEPILTHRSQRFCREAVAWRHLRHPNVLPLFVATLDRQELKFALVSKWLDNGNINKFIEKHGGVNRAQLVSCHICICRAQDNQVPKLVDVAHGLQYLHSFNFVHGDLKGVR